MSSNSIVKQTKIGIIGGFGGYATLRFFERLLEEFAGDSERGYPHIIMDNDFTMPSRTRALLYGDDWDEIVLRISDSIKRMMESYSSIDYIIMPCGTAHAFLPDVYKKYPKAKGVVVDIISALYEELSNCGGVKKTLIIAAEGTLKRQVYSKYFEEIVCVEPSDDYYERIRIYIECVKQNNYDDGIFEDFFCLLDYFSCEHIVLGCTEFPVFIEEAKRRGNEKELAKYKFYDPLESVIRKIKADL